MPTQKNARASNAATRQSNKLPPFVPGSPPSPSRPRVGARTAGGECPDCGRVYQPGEAWFACGAACKSETPPAPAREATAYAKFLACALWREHYAVKAPEWEPGDSLMGVLSQIDNMLCGLKAPAAGAVVVDDRVAYRALRVFYNDRQGTVYVPGLIKAMRAALTAAIGGA